MSARKGLVPDANILIRAVLGRRVRSLLETYEDSTDFYAPDVCFDDAREYVPGVLGSRGEDPEVGLAVLEQIRVASGAPLAFKQEDITFSGHAIECRTNAENPRTFRPSPGQITYWHPPGGLGVRVDSGVYQGYRIPPFYDSLIGKLIVHGKNRNECLMRLRRALSEFVIDGIETTIPLFNELIRQPDIANGLYDIHWLEKYLGKS